MQHFRKYELTPTQWATAKAKIEVTHEGPEGPTTSWDAEKVAAVVELGKLCTEWGTNEEGEQVCNKYASKISVDILWAGEPLTTSFASYVVWPEPCGVHVFAGWEAQYAADYCAANPEAAYCQPPKPLGDE
jgi:hypothetical protein